MDISERKTLEEQAQELSIRDSLTGAYNRRYLYTRLDEISAEYSKQGQNICISLLDIDRIKEVNDSYGHQAGDLVLKGFSQIVNSAIRQNDIFSRVGGDEFIIVFINSTKHEAIEMMEKIMATIRQTTFSYEDHKINITFCCSISDSSEMRRKLFSAEEMIDRAQNGLHVAKGRGGRDRCISDT